MQVSWVRFILRCLAYIWASPWTLAALALAAISSFGGTSIHRCGSVLGCYGGPIEWLLRKAPIPGGAAAMTFGHTILARNRKSFDRTLLHELVHVRQYERWGPFFVPAYLCFSIILAISGRDAYRDNPFEKEAFESDRLREQLNQR